MKKKIYNLLDEVTDQYVPDNFDSIMKEIEKMNESPTSIVYPFQKKKTTAYKWKYAVVAASICSIIAIGTFVSTMYKNTIPHLDGTKSSNHISNVQPSVPTKELFWNEGISLNKARLAGEFVSVREKEWKSIFDVEITVEGSIDYFFVYEKNKENNVTNNIMLGYVLIEENNGTSCSLYISKSALVLSPVFVDTSTLKKSKIENMNVFLGTEIDGCYWAAFEQESYSFITSIYGATKEHTVQIVESLIK